MHLPRSPRLRGGAGPGSCCRRDASRRPARSATRRRPAGSGGLPVGPRDYPVSVLRPRDVGAVRADAVKRRSGLDLGREVGLRSGRASPSDGRASPAAPLFPCTSPCRRPYFRCPQHSMRHRGMSTMVASTGKISSPWRCRGPGHLRGQHLRPGRSGRGHVPNSDRPGPPRRKRVPLHIGGVWRRRSVDVVGPRRVVGLQRVDGCVEAQMFGEQPS